MRLTPALAYEKLRQDADSMNKIILNKDGKWYHVYEWSAWLLKTVVCTEEMQQARGDAKPLAVSHCNTKTGDYVMAGFPLESVAKYIPEYTDMKEMEDGDLCIGITLPDEAWLLSLVPEIRTFLKDRLHLELHMGKLHITRASQGAEFLGGYVKPHTTYISSESLQRMKASVDDINPHHPQKTWASVCSFLGVLSHYDSYNIRSRMFFNSELLTIGTFDRDMTQYFLRERLVNPKPHFARLLEHVEF